MQRKKENDDVIQGTFAGKEGSDDSSLVGLKYKHRLTRKGPGLQNLGDGKWLLRGAGQGRLGLEKRKLLNKWLDGKHGLERISVIKSQGF